jgi:hypothetical protein
MLWCNNKFARSFNGKAITETTIQKIPGQYENIISYRRRLLTFSVRTFICPQSPAGWNFFGIQILKLHSSTNTDYFLLYIT